jgi:molecular chaperone GrpE
MMPNPSPNEAQSASPHPVSENEVSDSQVAHVDAAASASLPEDRQEADSILHASAEQPDHADQSSRLMQELEQLREQLKAAQEQALRAMAEMDNLRKRTAQEVSNAHKYAVESFAESLVPVLDSLELSLKVDNPSVETLKEGADATLRLLHAAFEKNHLIAIEPVGQRFDPNRHQAISMVPGSSVMPAVSANHVVTVLQKGYLIHDRVLRPALVTVAQA